MPKAVYMYEPGSYLRHTKAVRGLANAPSGIHLKNNCVSVNIPEILCSDFQALSRELTSFSEYECVSIIMHVHVF